MTVLPGAHIRAGAVITAGSTVVGEIQRGSWPAVPRPSAPTLDGVEQPVSAEARTPDAWATLVGPARSDGRAEVRIGRCLIVSDFTVDPLAPALDAATPALSAEIAPFGTVVPSMMDHHRTPSRRWWCGPGQS